MHSIDIIDNCVAEKEEYTVTVGVFENNQPRYIVFGGGGAIVAPIEHEYELCGVTQVFTAALAQRLIAQDKMSLLSQVSHFSMLVPPEKDFTVQQLLHRTTGLVMPLILRLKLLYASFKPQINPYENADNKALLDLLLKCRLKESAPPCEIEYALLGEIIAKTCDESFAKQIMRFIAEDLRLTGVRLANKSGTLPTPYWQFADNCTFLASNGLVANVTACLRFLQGRLHGGIANENISSPAEDSGITECTNSIAAGWRTSADGLIWQSGTNAGFNSFFGLDYKSERAVCVLSNTPALPRKSAAEAGLLYLREKREGKEFVFM